VWESEGSKGWLAGWTYKAQTSSKTISKTGQTRQKASFIQGLKASSKQAKEGGCSRGASWGSCTSCSTQALKPGQENHYQTAFWANLNNTTLLHYLASHFLMESRDCSYCGWLYSLMVMGTALVIQDRRIAEIAAVPPTVVVTTRF
jgi:hypothetical protein